MSLGLITGWSGDRGACGGESRTQTPRVLSEPWGLELRNEFLAGFQSPCLRFWAPVVRGGQNKKDSLLCGMGKLLQALGLICCPVTEAPKHLLVNMSLMEELSIHSSSSRLWRGHLYLAQNLLVTRFPMLGAIIQVGTRSPPRVSSFLYWRDKCPHRGAVESRLALPLVSAEAGSTKMKDNVWGNKGSKDGSHCFVHTHRVFIKTMHSGLFSHTWKLKIAFIANHMFLLPVLYFF